MNRLIILSTQTINGGYRLARTSNDFAEIHATGCCTDVVFKLPGIDEIHIDALDTYNNYPHQGAISSRAISDWIISKAYGHTEPRQPNRLLFRLEISNGVHTYTFIGKINDVNEKAL